MKTRPHRVPGSVKRSRASTSSHRVAEFAPLLHVHWGNINHRLNMEATDLQTVSLYRQMHWVKMTFRFSALAAEFQPTDRVYINLITGLCFLFECHVGLVLSVWKYCIYILDLIVLSLFSDWGWTALPLLTRQSNLYYV